MSSLKKPRQFDDNDNIIGDDDELLSYLLDHCPVLGCNYEITGICFLAQLRAENNDELATILETSSSTCRER